MKSTIFIKKLRSVIKLTTKHRKTAQNIRCSNSRKDRQSAHTHTLSQPRDSDSNQSVSVQQCTHTEQDIPGYTNVSNIPYMQYRIHRKLHSRQDRIIFGQYRAILTNHRRTVGTNNFSLFTNSEKHTADQDMHNVH